MAACRLFLWLAHADNTRCIIRDNYAHLDGDRLLTAAVEENVLVQLAEPVTVFRTADAV